MSDGSTSAAPGVCKAEPAKPTSAGQTALTPHITDFLNFCRIEKGLAANSLEAYRRDLQRYSAYFHGHNGIQVPYNHTDTVLGYLNSLYRLGLESRSIARHLASLRNFYSFLLREGKVASDPTEHIRTPKQWKSIPKFLNLSQINKLLQAPDGPLPTGVRDRAMLELLYV
jgi:integrase/recombinase XerD